MPPDLSHITESLRSLAVPVASLTPDPNNARRHGDKNVAATRASMVRFGQRLPLVVQRQGMVVRVGNNRLQIARDLGWSHVAAVVVDEADVEAAAYAIADNHTGELATWDEATLRATLASLPGEQALAAWGDKGDLQRLLFPDGAREYNAKEPKPDPVPVVKPGEVWLCGSHVVTCGDCRDPAVVDALLAGRRPDLVLTDPPYGIDYVGPVGSERKGIKNDGHGDLAGLLKPAFTQCIRVAKPGACWYVTAPPGPQFLDFAVELKALGVWRQTLVWVKNSFVFGRSDYHYRHEAVFYGWSPGAGHRRPPTRTLSTVLEYNRPQASEEHPTKKPVELFQAMLEASTDTGALVFDPFAGSGTTLIAAELAGRVAAVIELDPIHASTIVRRWQDVTTKKASRLSDEALFDDVRNAALSAATSADG